MVDGYPEAGIPGVLRLTGGFPAGTDRGMVDNSSGMALLVDFADAVAHDIYQEHPDHLRFIDECSKFWSRVQVYNMVPSQGRARPHRRRPYTVLFERDKPKEHGPLRKVFSLRTMFI